MRGRLLVAVALLLAAAALGALRRPPAAPPPLVLPPFALTERSGASVSDVDLRGRVWVAGFVFTRCPTVCPRLAQVMAGLQAPLRALPGGDEARLVAISVDPEHDTPAVLSAWARGLDADPARWLFLTGERGAIWRLAERGFKLPVARDAGRPGHIIVHSQRLVVVDRGGRLRGWFDALDDPGGRDALLEAVGQALVEPP